MGDDKKLIDGAKEEWTVTPSSPYFLGSGDQPGNIITHVIFTGENYVSWARAMTLSLRARRKYDFVDGSISKPNGSSAILDWDTVHSMVVSWMLRSMESKVAATIPMHENAKDLWDYLERRFCVANGPRIQQIKAAITDCKQTDTMTIDAYYTKLLGLYDELARLKPLPTCECKKCECGMALKLSQDRDEEIFHQFLIGLDGKSYGAVRTNLLSQQPLGDINRAYQALLQEEQSRAITSSRTTLDNVHAFCAQSERGKGAYNRVDKSKLLCSHCKQRGHEIGTCFKLHGNPPWYEERIRARQAARSDGSTVSSRTTGGPVASGAGGSHSSGAGSSSTAGSGSRSTGGVTGARAHVVLDGAESDSPAPLANLTPEQVTALMNLINTEQNNCEPMTGEMCDSEWIIDTGASHHITGTLSALSSIRDVGGRPVGLPDGSSIVATKEGDVFLTDCLVLRNVLFVPAFNCNLISVSHLVSDNGCTVQFTSSLCAI